MTHPTTRTYWLEHAWLDTNVEPGVALDVADGRITAVRTGVDAPPPGAEPLRGLTLPGLANAHSHAFHRALRGTVQVGSGTFWTWRELMYSFADQLTPDTYHALARAVYAEMALAGITAVGEFHYVHHAHGGTPYADPNAMGEALIAAASEAGIRITLLDTAYLSSGFGQPPTATSSASPTEARTPGRNAVHFSRNGITRGSVPPSTPYGPCPHGSWRRWPAGPKSAGPRSTSTSPSRPPRTTPAAPPTTAPRPNSSPTTGCWAPAPPASTTRTSRTRTSRCWGARAPVPACARRRNGTLPTASARRSPSNEPASPLSLGSDSHAVIDLLEEARAMELNERLRTRTRGHWTAAALLRAASADGHAALGWEEAGTLEAGALADFTTIALDSVRTAGPVPRLGAETAVFAATAADVRHTVVGGQDVVRDGAHALVPDVPQALAAAVEALRA